MKKKNAIIFVTIHLLIMLGFFLISYIFYPLSERQMDFLTIRLLEEIHKEVIIYKNETGGLPENLNNLLQYDAETHRLFFGTKPLKGRLYQKPNTLPEEELDGYDVNKVFYYEIEGNSPVISYVGDDGKSGGGDDLSYPIKRSLLVPFRDFIATEFFVRTLLFGIPWTFVLSLCLYRIWSDRKRDSMSVVGGIISSIAFFVIACIATYIILVLHVYPHH